MSCRRAICTDRRFRSYILCTKRYGRGVKTGLDECKACDYYEGTVEQNSSNPFNHNWEVICMYEAEDNNVNN